MDQKIELITNNSLAFKNRLELIAAAQKSIALDIFYIESDDSGKSILNALIDKKKMHSHIKVELNIDSWGSQTAPYNLIAQLRSCGAKINYFNPSTLLSGYNHQLRNHRKSLVIDNQVFLLGSRNIADYHFAQNPRHDFLDVDIQFVLSRNNTIIQDDVHNPQKVRHFPFVLRELLMSAEKEILIESAHFIPPQEFVDILKYKKNKGIDIQILTNSLQASLPEDYLSIRVSNLKKAQLAKAGVAVSEIVHFSSGVRKGTHSKYTLVDGRRAFVGSYNWDSRSLYINAEIGVLTSAESVVQKLREEFFLRKGVYFQAFHPQSESDQFKKLKLNDRMLYKLIKPVAPYLENYL